MAITGRGFPIRPKYTRPYGGTASGITQRLKVWNGSAWVAKPAKIFTGGSWVEKPAKTWNGSSWV